MALLALARELPHLGRADEVRPYLDEAADIFRQLTRLNPEFLAFLTAMARKQGITITEDGRFAEPDPVEHLRRTTTAPPEPGALARIQKLNENALRLATSGSLDLAVGMARDAVDLCREAARTSPGVKIALARSLHNLALVQSWNGQLADALAAADESVHLGRRMLAAAPELVRPLLADALDTLATRLAAVGRPHDALPPAEESVALHRQLAAADPTFQLAGMARVLNNLSNRLVGADRHAESLATTQEVVALHRRLRADEPGKHLTGLLHGLANLGIRLHRMGREGEILAPTQEAVELLSELTELTEIHPGNDLAGLAESLAWLGDRLAEQGHRPEGRAAVRAAKDLRRRVRTGR
ncbi:tetratricopeptide repeat protein [Streptomyces sp. NPDC048442]|uniref:tetratricopeptide repeat protein n=1 Tax=Streptomyces sp. NPDC048442 TaxID=3154823 RepID=UPI00342EE561